MTIPIVPGPFSFLAEAGEALGDIGQLREQRKERAQQIAEHGSTRVLDMILQGADPAMLDDPNVQKMFKTAGYPVVSSKVAKLMGAGEREKGREAEALGGAGFPIAAAGAATRTARLTEAKAGAELPLVGLEADAKEAELLATKSGAQFDRARYDEARRMLGDKTFAKTAAEVVAGVWDARLRSLALHREELSYDKALLAQRGMELRSIGQDADRAYEGVIARHDKEIRDAILMSTGKIGDEETVAKWKQANPPPDRDSVTAAVIKSRTGWTAEEYYRRVGDVFSNLFKDETKPGITPPGAAPKAGTPAPGGAGAVTPPPGGEGGTPVQKALGALSKVDDPEEAAGYLLGAEAKDLLVEEQSAQVVAMLKLHKPAAWFRKFKAKYEEGKYPIQPPAP